MNPEHKPASLLRRPWWVWLIGCLLLLIGGALIVAGDRIAGLDDYQRSIFAHVGTAIGLVGPLFIAERLLSIQVDAARAEAAAARSTAGHALEEVRSVRSAIDQEVRDRLDQVRRETRQRQQNATEGSFHDLIALYDEAAAHRWIDRRGLRVPTGLPGIWLRVRALRRSFDGDEVQLIELDFEGADLEPIGESAIWSAEDSAADAFFRLIDGLKGTSHWPGDQVFEVGALLQAITDALRKSIDLHTGEQGHQRIGQIVEVIDDVWIVTREGLDCIAEPEIHVDRDELIYQSDLALDRVTEIVLLLELDRDQFRHAFSNAEHVHKALRGETLNMLGNQAL